MIIKFSSSIIWLNVCAVPLVQSCLLNARNFVYILTKLSQFMWSCRLFVLIKTSSRRIRPTHRYFSRSISIRHVKLADPVARFGDPNYSARAWGSNSWREPHVGVLRRLRCWRAFEKVTPKQSWVIIISVFPLGTAKFVTKIKMGARNSPITCQRGEILVCTKDGPRD